MDPLTGKLFIDEASAREAGISNPLLVQGRHEDVLRVSRATKAKYDEEQRKKKRGQARKSRKRNR